MEVLKARKSSPKAGKISPEIQKAIDRASGHRDHQDGEPFYCTYCGSGFSEYYACEDVRCVLETKSTAMKRYIPSAKIPRIIGYNVGDYSDIMEE